MCKSALKTGGKDKNRLTTKSVKDTGDEALVKVRKSAMTLRVIKEARG